MDAEVGELFFERISSNISFNQTYIVTPVKAFG